MPADRAGTRIDFLSAELSGLTRSKIQRYIERGLVHVNGREVRPNYRVRPRDLITITLPARTETLAPGDIPLDMLYQDDALMVVNKPAGLVVHPAAGNMTGTLMNAVARQAPHLAEAGAPLRPGVVHRLDKDTSGVLVIALRDASYYDLVGQFSRRTINRRYLALVYGSLKGDSGELSAHIGRSVSDRKKMSTRTRRGREAVTRWRTLERYRGATLLEVVLGTGRTHQIRVHFASIGHPVLGDQTYGKKTVIESSGGKLKISRQMLHAELLGFIHPATGNYMEFSSEPPEDMKEVISILRASCTA